MTNSKKVLFFGLLFLASLVNAGLDEDLLRAILNQDVKKVENILQNVDFDFKNSPLRVHFFHEAAKDGSSEIIQKLIGAGLDINAQRGPGATALFFAVMGQHINGVRTLIKNGASPLITRNNGRTLLHIVAGQNQTIEMVQELINVGIDVNAKDFDGDSPLSTAAYFGRTDLVELLLKNGSHPSDRDLHTACLGKYADEILLKKLCDAGLNIESRDRIGQTPLHAAAWSKNIKAVRFLLQNGASVHVNNSEGHTPLCYCSNFHDSFLHITKQYQNYDQKINNEIKCILIQAGASLLDCKQFSSTVSTLTLLTSVLPFLQSNL